MTDTLELSAKLAPRIEAAHLKGRDGKPYRAGGGLVAAANVALKLERPLLLTGEPGCGKTDFAWAAANALAVAMGHQELEPLQCQVRSDTRARDLLYTYDAIQRYGEAQSGGAEGKRRAADPRHYIKLEALGLGLVSKARRVVLIDEIDKAPRDLPNDLLRELERRNFEIAEIPLEANGPAVTSQGAELKRVMDRPRSSDGPAVPAPLIVITSNVERQLPEAFLRRCVFWHIAFPEALLPTIIRDHFPALTTDEIDDRVKIHAAARSARGVSRRPGTAELLDWVRALADVFEPAYAAQRLKSVRSALDGDPRAVPWKDLPALGCLIKTREDQSALGVS